MAHQITITLFLFACLVGSSHMQNVQPLNGPIAPNQQFQGPLNQPNMNMPAQGQMNLPNMQDMLRQNQLGQNNFLSDLLSGNGGIGQTLRQIPARGMEMINNVLNNVRNMLPGLGRNGNNQLNQQQLNMPNRMNGQQPNLNLPNLPNLNDLTRPITDSLQQGRLPDVNQLTNGLTNGLTRTLSNLANPSANANTNYNPGNLQYPNQQV